MIHPGRLLAALACSFGLGTACPAAPGSYQNPVPLRLANGESAQNCADPAVLREARAATPTWYLFCTSDPVSRRERGVDGGWRFHLLPIYRSHDLVHWDFVSDAFASRPAGLATPGAGLWAPEPVYMNGRYYLYFTVTDVPDAVGAEPGCERDSAIGVATAATPAGPWRAERRPVLLPRPLGPGCAFQTTYDPKVVVDDERKYLYYGSYGGGIWVTRLDDDGMAVHGDAVRVGADGRYEAAEVVRRDGWWYLFASATDCCRGPLTGYAVFVGRARTPEGPFLDRLGQDMAKGRAGGTPFLLQNGNRWVGPGHNTVFQDGAGAWWTMYHAVDTGDPWFGAPGGLTRRAALLDRVDWVDGWPVAGGVQLPAEAATQMPTVAPTDTPQAMPAPAAAAVQAPPPARTAAIAVDEARLLWRDDLANPDMEERWLWRRPPPEGSITAGAGGLTLPVQRGELYLDTNDASVLQAALPAGDYRVELALRLTLPDGAWGQAGLVVMRDDDNYVKLVELARGPLRQVEFGKEMAPVDANAPRYGNTLAGTPGAVTYLRLDVHRDGVLERYSAWSSRDGRNWVGGGTWQHRLGKARLGLVAMGADGKAGVAGRALFSQVAVYRLSRQIYDPHDAGQKPLPAREPGQ